MKVSWAASVTVWVLSAVAGAMVVALADRDERPGLLSLALAGAVVLSFCIHLATADRRGFVTRLMTSTLGAFAILALASLAALAAP